jgi:hypothetical protein
VASVGTTIHVKYLSSYLTCTCQVEHCVDNVFYFRDRFHWLICREKFLGNIFIQWCVYDPGGYCVEADAFFRVLDCETRWR